MLQAWGWVAGWLWRGKGPGSVGWCSAEHELTDGLVACGSNGNGRTVGLDGLAGPFQPCDCMTLWFYRKLFGANPQNSGSMYAPRGFLLAQRRQNTRSRWLLSHQKHIAPIGQCRIRWDRGTLCKRGKTWAIFKTAIRISWRNNNNCVRLINRCNFLKCRKNTYKSQSFAVFALNFIFGLATVFLCDLGMSFPSLSLCSASTTPLSCLFILTLMLKYSSLFVLSTESVPLFR